MEVIYIYKFQDHQYLDTKQIKLNLITTVDFYRKNDPGMPRLDKDMRKQWGKNCFQTFV